MLVIRILYFYNLLVNCEIYVMVSDTSTEMPLNRLFNRIFGK